MVPECPHHCYWRSQDDGTWGTVNNRISYAGPSNGQLHTSDPPGHPRGRVAWSNLMSFPTDYDQRDERLGWMGDAGLSSDSMLLNFHMDSFLPHYAQLMAGDKVKGPTLSDVVQCCTGNVFSLIIEL